MYPEVSEQEVARRLERCRGDLDATVQALLEYADTNDKEELPSEQKMSTKHEVSIRGSPTLASQFFSKEIYSTVPLSYKHSLSQIL